MNYKKLTIVIVFLSGILSLPFFLEMTQLAPLASDIQEAVRMAQALPEYPSIDNNDWHNPDYTSLYRQLKPTYWSRFLRMIGLREPFWTAQETQRLMRRVIDTRNRHEITTDFVQVLRSSSYTNIAVFGALDGGFHALVRGLQELKNLNILHDDLTLMPDHYIVFNGNAMNGSAFNFQTLLLICVLMDKNPEQVMYIAGAAEQREVWHESVLAHQLAEYNAPVDAFLADVKAFFQTLPSALYVLEEERAFCLLPDVQDALATRVPEMPLNEGLTRISLADVMQQKAAATPFALVTSVTPPLGLGLQQEGSDPVVWKVASGQTEVNRVLHHFFYDVFVLITNGSEDIWTITLYQRDVRKKMLFDPISTYFLSSGQLASGKELPVSKERYAQLQQEVRAAEAELASLRALCPSGQEPVVEGQESKAVQDDTIVLGCTLDLSKGAATHAITLKLGIELGLNHINEKGGIHGKLLRVIFAEDAYEPDRARQNVLRFLQGNYTDIIFSSVGSATLDGYIDLVEKGEVLVLFPITGAALFDRPVLSHVISYRPSYVQELYATTAYAMQSYRPLKAAVFYQDDTFGRSGLRGATQALKDHSDAQILKVAYNRNDLNFVKQAEKIRQFEPDMIIFCATSTAAKGIIRQLGVQAFTRKVLCGVSDLGEVTFQSFLQDKGLKVYVPSVVPNPETSDEVLIREFRAYVRGTDVPLDPFAFEGFLNTKITQYILDNLDGPIQMDRIIAFAEAMHAVNMGGIQLSFDAASHSLSDHIWISYGASKDWKKIAVPPLHEIYSQQGIERADPLPIMEEVDAV